MWTVTRAVELKSFKVFDDGVAAIQWVSGDLLVGVSNLIISYSPSGQLIRKILSAENVILGFSKISEVVLVITKNIESIRINKLYFDNNSISDDHLSFYLSDSCSSFFSTSAGPLTFWFGLRDGSIFRFSWDIKTFEKIVTILKSVTHL
jgi:hypothetical protein